MMKFPNPWKFMPAVIAIATPPAMTIHQPKNMRYFRGLLNFRSAGLVEAARV